MPVHSLMRLLLLPYILLPTVVSLTYSVTRKSRMRVRREVAMTCGEISWGFHLDEI